MVFQTMSTIVLADYHLCYGQNLGLVGFEGEKALTDDDSLVSVIVLFRSHPPAVQMAMFRALGIAPFSEDVARNIAQADHVLFRKEIDSLFATPFRAGGTEHKPAFYIRWVYTTALNGVNIVIPSNMVASLAYFESVRVVYPDFYVGIDFLPDYEFEIAIP